MQATIENLAFEDIEALTPVLSTWVRDEGQILQDEIDSIKQDMKDSLGDKNEYTYLVARDEQGVAIGMVGLRNPEPKMQEYTNSQNPAEMINAFISADYRGKGIGRKLIQAIFEKAKDLGFTEVVLNSGPRYEDTGWEFYNKVIGEPIAIAKDFYGDGYHAPVWRKVLD